MQGEPPRSQGALTNSRFPFPVPRFLQPLYIIGPARFNTLQAPHVSNFQMYTPQVVRNDKGPSRIAPPPPSEVTSAAAAMGGLALREMGDAADRTPGGIHPP